jgi:hypothetical protein
MVCPATQGYRYEVWCIARTLGTRYCVVRRSMACQRGTTPAHNGSAGPLTAHNAGAEESSGVQPAAHIAPTLANRCMWTHPLMFAGNGTNHVQRRSATCHTCACPVGSEAIWQ